MRKNRTMAQTPARVPCKERSAGLHVPYSGRRCEATFSDTCLSALLSIRFARLLIDDLQSAMPSTISRVSRKRRLERGRYHWFESDGRIVTLQLNHGCCGAHGFADGNVSQVKALVEGAQLVQQDARSLYRGCCGTHDVPCSFVHARGT